MKNAGSASLVAVVLSVMLVCPFVARAQPELLDAALAHRAQVLEGRLARRPTPRDRCELGFIYVRQGRTAEAATTLDRAITDLGSPTSALDRRTLAACLYSRGRAAEASGDLERARVVYGRSLELRDDRTTRERVMALAVPIYPSDTTRARPIASLPPDEAAAVAGSSWARDEDGAARVVTVARPARAGTVAWSLVAWESRSPGPMRGLAAVACDAGDCAATDVDDDTTLGGNGFATVLSFVAHDGEVPILEIRMLRNASESDGEEDVPTVDETTLHLCGLLEDGVVCVQIPIQDRIERVTYDATFTDGHLVLHRVSGRAPDDLWVPLDRPLTFDDLLDAAEADD